MSAVIVQLEELRRQVGRRQERCDSAFRAALLKAAPALIAAAAVVAEGDWECERPMARLGARGRVLDWEDCGTCSACRLKAARERLAEVEL